MRTWTTTTTVGADPVAVLDVLTDPQACRRWAPVAFNVSGLRDDWLSAGSHARKSPPGRLRARQARKLRRIAMQSETNRPIPARNAAITA